MNDQNLPSYLIFRNVYVITKTLAKNQKSKPPAPEDLETEILCRVPATSVKRFHRLRLRSTCKRWNRLFSDSRFTRKQLEKAAKQFLVLMLRECRVCSMSVNWMIPSVDGSGELSLIEPFCERQLQISQVFHCDGLLLCTDKDNSIIVVWNPCTGQTRWIQPRNGDTTSEYYALGSYQDNKSSNKSYKILGYGDAQEFEIYELNSNSWRTLDVTPNCCHIYTEFGASLKGKTYWFALDEKEEQLDRFLVSFDYTTEIFERLTCQFPISMDKQAVLSVVREEKLSMLVKPENTSKTEIWLTNKIDETKPVSWTKVLSLDLSPYLRVSYEGSFLLDEEKKVFVLCDCYQRKNVVYIIEEDNRVTNLNFGGKFGRPFLFNYVPSLTQIQQGVGVGGK